MAALKKVELCVAELAAWLIKNLLKLNREQSEAIVFCPVKQCNLLPADVYITVAGHRNQPSSCVRNLGVQFDSNLKMEHQIANTEKLLLSDKKYWANSATSDRRIMQNTCSRPSDITFRLWKCTSLWSPTDGAATFTKGT